MAGGGTTATITLRNLSYKHYAIPRDISAVGDTVDIQESFEMLAVYYVCMMALLTAGRKSDVAPWKDLYDSGLVSMRRFMTDRKSSAPVVQRTANRVVRPRG